MRRLEAPGPPAEPPSTTALSFFNDLYQLSLLPGIPLSSKFDAN
jgi:hypothetical protein